MKNQMEKNFLAGALFVGVLIFAISINVFYAYLVATLLSWILGFVGISTIIGYSTFKFMFVISLIVVFLFSKSDKK
jgi:hypothetical protein